MKSIFGPDGLIAKAHPEYEHRPGQIDMAEAVLRAFEQKQHLIVEAGTGTGKTLAYLVPAIAENSRTCRRTCRSGDTSMRVPILVSVRSVRTTIRASSRACASARSMLM